MKRVHSPRLGVDQGDIEVFSEFENGGPMWTGAGPRERRRSVRFSEPFAELPVVHLSSSLMDIDSGAALRAELVADTITTEGFDVVFRTWNDSRIARIRASWLAIGSLPFADDWDVP
ncbi:H-type lectin domain-containing protein [Phaeobacter inhibens]|uniref:H-type lectin domain-containing protein n=1 Tax=Phaeobacter inhibens TaxID=221822 RepID=UPI000C99D1EA|nr:H-type lectin domain-containing protein [Phaeobacter inhibens]AUQ59295.1 H-type lectin domain protein [Phaeobacter inhibens]AUQ63372.1 H-type lectin domain protein [Phaeobacter inhibens]AUQ83278.1 H-type lectin domain protein [Phaeobacter inhibens]AUQ91037.1 H-type lectin domain protein [Phaeobacter inhibens]AUR08576.1 H-type lectin domain protein [Phaeobacter inhibens]